MTYYLEHHSPVGKLLIAASDIGISGVYFEQHRHFKGKNGWQYTPTHPYLTQATQQLDDYFLGHHQQFDLPLDLPGTHFQRAVWQALLGIGFGQSCSYAHIAERIGKARAVRAVGTAIGRNPISIIIPCHRILGSTGALTGYAGGLKRKAYLLRHEQHDSNKLLSSDMTPSEQEDLVCELNRLKMTSPS